MNTGAFVDVNPAPPAVKVGPDGRVHGVDGMLDQVGEALMRHAGPMIVRDVLPVVRQDTAIQDRIGAAAGKAAADHLMPWVVAGTVLTAMGVAFVFMNHRKTARHRRR